MLLGLALGEKTRGARLRCSQAHARRCLIPGRLNAIVQRHEHLEPFLCGLWCCRRRTWRFVSVTTLCATAESMMSSRRWYSRSFPSAQHIAFSPVHQRIFRYSPHPARSEASRSVIRCHGSTRKPYCRCKRLNSCAAVSFNTHELVKRRGR